MRTFLVLLFVASVVAQNAAPRGVNPSNSAAYSGEKSTFTCLDSSLTIPFSSVNDDYCDCPDGSDEPGTSACNNGRFYCKNEGFKPSYIPSSKVNDGICDHECCDGSEEYDSDVKCPNICKTLGEESLRKEAELNKIKKTALKIKRTYLDFGAIAKANRDKEIQNLKAKLVDVEKKLKPALEIRDRAEEIDRIKRDAKSKSAAKLRHCTECPEKLSTCDDRVAALKERARNLRGKLESETYRLNDQIKKANEIIDLLNAIPTDSSLRGNHHLSKAFELVALYSIAEHKHEESTDSDQQIEDWYDNFQLSDATPEELKEAGIDEDTDLSPCDDPNSHVSLCLKRTLKASMKVVGDSITNVVTWPGFGKIVTTVSHIFVPKSEIKDEAIDLEAARKVAEELQNQKNDIDNKLAELETKKSMDFGPGLVWEKLYNKCFTIDVAEYTYEACMLGKATQTSKNGGSATSLGSFSRWGPRDGEVTESNKYLKMYFGNGEQCWNGPQRSLELTLECGIENALLSVSEPSKCVYNIKMKTPAVCEAVEDVSEKHDEL